MFKSFMSSKNDLYFQTLAAIRQVKVPCSDPDVALFQFIFIINLNVAMDFTL